MFFSPKFRFRIQPGELCRGRGWLTEIDWWRTLCSRYWFPGLAESCVKGAHQVRPQSVRTGNRARKWARMCFSYSQGSKHDQDHARAMFGVTGPGLLAYNRTKSMCAVTVHPDLPLHSGIKVWDTHWVQRDGSGWVGSVHISGLVDVL